MAPSLGRRTLDGGAPNLDAAGIAYITTAILYSFVVFAELFLLYRRRSSFYIRIRNLYLVFLSVSLLHVYLIVVLLVYPLNGRWPCSAEYWVMSILLPSGMAVFQGKLCIPHDAYLLKLTRQSLQCKSSRSLREPAKDEN